MNTKIKTEIGVGIIIAISMIVGGLIWVGNKEDKQIFKMTPKSEDTIIQDVTKGASGEAGSDFCEANLEKKPNDEIGESTMKDEGWKKYINYRDGYEIDFPADELDIQGNDFFGAGSGYYSAIIGYTSRLGTYGLISVYCGDIDSTLSAMEKAREESQEYMATREEIIKNEKLNINGMDALVVEKKIINPTATENFSTASVYFIQYKKDRVLVITGENEAMFNKMVKTLAPISSNIPASTVASRPSIRDIREIEGGKEMNGFKSYSLSIDNFKNPVWLCMQPDWYSKPDNKECNGGQLIETAESEIFLSGFDNALVIIYSDSEQTEFYDGVYATKSAEGIKTAPFSELCGLVKNNQDGGYFINDQRLLTAPGWKDLIPYINRDACIKGVQYNKSFRVYFIGDK